MMLFFSGLLKIIMVSLLKFIIELNYTIFLKYFSIKDVAQVSFTFTSQDPDHVCKYFYNMVNSKPYTININSTPVTTKTIDSNGNVQTNTYMVQGLTDRITHNWLNNEYLVSSVTNTLEGPFYIKKIVSDEFIGYRP